MPRSDLPQISATDVVEAEFLEYFRLRGYALLPGSSLVDESVRMSFVMSAGLVQVERALLKTGQPLGRQFALVQSCFRHFDMMEGFGSSPFHLSFFRMAGAFFFGKIVKPARIAEIWELLSAAFQLKAESLWLTFFNGGTIWGHAFEPDLETYECWLKLGIPAGRIVGLEENFWKQSAFMGTSEKHPYPKCGPNCEVFFDRGEVFACGSDCRPGCACGRFVEFLNILFIGWERNPDRDQIRPLADPFIEVVIGVERLAMILQGSSSVYDLECFPRLFEALRESMGNHALQGREQEIQMRLLVDHLRAMLFLVADGAPPPGHGGRSRIIRRLGRNLLTAQSLLDLPLDGENKISPVIGSMIDLIVRFYRAEHSIAGNSVPRMLAAHPGLPTASGKVVNYLNTEAILFDKTIRRGLRILEQLISSRPANSIHGSEMLTLVTSLGLPEPLLVRELNRRHIDYSWEEYMSKRTKWQEAAKS